MLEVTTMSRNEKRILVFGATGEIGSRIVRGCVDFGHKVTGITRGTNSRHRVDLDGAELLAGDKGKEDCYTRVLAGREFDVVIDTVPATEHVELAFRHFNNRIEHYFMCSSTGTFVPLQYIPADEKHPWQEDTGVNFFHQSQRDAYALELFKQHGFPVTVFRPTMIIGPGRIPLELWGGRNPLYFKMMRENQPLEIVGSGEILLQGGYNDDLASGFVLGASAGPEISGEIFSISCKRSVTLKHYFDVAKDFLNSTSSVEYVTAEEILARRPDDASAKNAIFLCEHMCFDLEKAERILGYSPKYSIEQGLENALRWCLDTQTI